MKKTSIILAICLFSLTTIIAQSSPISFCGKVQIIDQKLEKKLHLFPEYTKFIQASLFQEKDSYTLEILHEFNNQIKVEQKKLTQADLDVICNKINNVIPKSKLKKNNNKFDKSGRKELLITSTVLGVGAYGWMVPASFDDMSLRSGLAAYMLIGAGSFFVPFALTSNKPVTRGMARGYGWGSFLGMTHGTMMRQLTRDLNSSFDINLIPTVLGGLVEGSAMYYLASKNDWDRGTVGMIGTGGLWGAGMGGSIGLISSPLSGNNTANLSKNITLGSSLLFSGLGMYGGYLWSQADGSVTNGDVIVINAAGFLGFRLGAALATTSDLFSGTEIRVKGGVGITALSAAAAIGYGLYHTSNYDYTTGEGVYISLGEVAGGLLGLGVTYLVTDELSDDSSAWSSTIGATAGFVLVDYFIRRNDVKVNSSIGNWSFDLNPMGFSPNFEYGKEVDLNQLQNASHAVKASLKF
ncbi:MAG: hypothetical protein ACPGXZ_17095 [Saprospiraceae bacterium]